MKRLYAPDLSAFTKDELCEIHHNLNCFKWDERLGVAPTKRFKYIGPIMEDIERMIGMKRILRHHHIHNLGKTETEFEEWYEIMVSNAIFGITRKRI